MPLDYQKLSHWPFAQVRKRYTREDIALIAQGYGAGLPGPLQAEDRRFIDSAGLEVLPPIVVALADGEFWQQRPEAGLQWQKVVHAEEAITFYRPLPPEGEVVIDRRIQAIYDRGAERGAAILERQMLSDADGKPIARIDVTTIARADGGFGGPLEPAKERIAWPERPADGSLELATPPEEGALFRLPATFDVAHAADAEGPRQSVLRGLCCYGLAGRAVLKLLCGNQPARLRKLAVRYAGPMLTGETVRIDVWKLATGRAVFKMLAVERNTPVLNHGLAEFDE